MLLTSHLDGLLSEHVGYKDREESSLEYGYKTKESRSIPREDVKLHKEILWKGELLDKDRIAASCSGAEMSCKTFGLTGLQKLR